MTQWIDRSHAETRFITAVLAAFSLSALVLGAIGIFGVITYTVSQRTPEIGIRVAQDAPPGTIVSMVLRQGLTFAVAVAAIGLSLSVCAGRLLSAFLFEVSPIDPATFGAAAVVFALVGLAACYVPARRAARIDPCAALRSN